MQRIMSEDFEEIVASNDIFFVYVTNYGTSMEEMVCSLSKLWLTSPGPGEEGCQAIGTLSPCLSD